MGLHQPLEPTVGRGRREIIQHRAQALILASRLVELDAWNEVFVAIPQRDKRTTLDAPTNRLRLYPFALGHHGQRNRPARLLNHLPASLDTSCSRLGKRGSGFIFKNTCCEGSDEHVWIIPAQRLSHLVFRQTHGNRFEPLRKHLPKAIVVFHIRRRTRVAVRIHHLCSDLSRPPFYILTRHAGLTERLYARHTPRL